MPRGMDLDIEFMTNLYDFRFKIYIKKVYVILFIRNLQLKK